MYKGNTQVEGPAHVRELTDLIISKITVGPYNNNSYLLRCRNTGSEVLIDAAAQPERLLNLIGPDGLMGVLTTHGHQDHWNALAEVVAATGAQTYAPQDDIELIGELTNHAMAPESMFTFGDISLKVLTTGGHTPGASMFSTTTHSATDTCFREIVFSPAAWGRPPPRLNSQLFSTA